MLRNVTDFRGYAIRASDGILGTVADLYFDDERWAIRYFVVETGGWLAGRTVLISPLAVGLPDWTGQLLPVSLTRSQVEHSPDVDTRKPVSRQVEAAYFQHYGYPNYWGGGGLWGMGAYPGSPTVEDWVNKEITDRRSAKSKTPDDCHLRSCNTVIGNHIHATDGDIGHVADFLVDDHTWAVRYLVADTSNWWSGHKVLVAPSWIEEVSWAEGKVFVDLTREAVKNAPPYDATAHFDRQQEQGIYQHHGRPDYWTAEAARSNAGLVTK